MKINKIFILFILIYNILNASTTDLLHLNNPTVNLFNKKFKGNSFSVKQKYVNQYNEIQNLLTYGLIIQAEKKANIFYNEANYLNSNNAILNNMANIALGNVYKAKGDIFDWKYFEIPTLKFILKYKPNKLGMNYVYFVSDMGDIILNKESRSMAKEMFYSAYRILVDNRGQISKKQFLKLKYKIFNSLYIYAIKYNYNVTKEQNAFAKVENVIIKRYSYSSIQEAILNLNRAKFYFNKKGNTNKAFINIKKSLNILHNLSTNNHIYNIQNSLVLAKVYFYLGKIYATGTKIKSAIKYYKKAENIYLKNKMYKKVLDSESQESIEYKVLNKNNKALKINHKELELAKKEYGANSEEYAVVLLLKSDFLADLNKYKEALNAIEMAKKIYIKKYGRFSKIVEIVNSNISFIKLKNSEF